MKTLTCAELGGPCDAALTGETFEEMGASSHAHVMEMIEQGDEAHKSTAEAMRSTPVEQVGAMMLEFQKKFDAAPTV